MRLVHNWSNEEAKHVKARYGLRKEYESRIIKKPGSKIDYHRSKSCPVDGCLAVTKVMSRHLRCVHKILPTEEMYKVLLSRAVILDRGRKQKVPCQPKEKRETLVPLLLQDEDLDSDSDSNDCSFEAPSHSSKSAHDPDDNASLSSESANSESTFESDADQLSSLGDADNESGKAVVKDMMHPFISS